MKIKTQKASPEFSKYVNFYWQIESEAGEFVPEQLIYPEATTELMFRWGEPFVSKFGGNNVKHSRATFCPQKTISASVESGAVIGAFVVNFSPFGAAAFIDAHFAEFRNTALDAEDLLGAFGRRLCEQITNAPNFGERIKLIETQLNSNFYQKALRDLETLNRAVEASRLIGAGTRAEDLAEAACVSFRTLDRLFARRIGLTPKEFLKIERLKIAVAMMKARSEANLTAVAYSAGYYDQSHFNKDFHAMVGVTPKGFVRLLSEEPACLES